MLTMAERPRGTNKRSRTAPMDCLTTVRRRRAVRLLADRSSPLTEQQLAARLAARARGVDADDVDDEVVRETRLGLRHVDLPKLAEAGLVSWDEEAATVRPADHPVLADDDFEALLQTADDDLVEAVASEPCREALVALSEGTNDVSVEELARQLAAQQRDGTLAPDAVDRTRIQLHHAVLPRLEAAGLIERDEEADTVSYAGPATLPGVAAVDETEPEADAESGSQIKIP